MRSFLISVVLVILVAGALGLLLFLAAIMPEDSPDIQGNLSVLVYSPVNPGSKDSYLVFVDEMQKPIKVPADSVIFKFDQETERPQVKLWLKEKEVAKRGEIWFRDGDQLREYLR